MGLCAILQQIVLLTLSLHGTAQLRLPRGCSASSSPAQCCMAHPRAALHPVAVPSATARCTAFPSCTPRYISAPHRIHTAQHCSVKPGPTRRPHPAIAPLSPPLPPRPLLPLSPRLALPLAAGDISGRDLAALTQRGRGLGAARQRGAPKMAAAAAAATPPGPAAGPRRFSLLAIVGGGCHRPGLLAAALQQLERGEPRPRGLVSRPPHGSGPDAGSAALRPPRARGGGRGEEGGDPRGGVPVGRAAGRGGPWGMPPPRRRFPPVVDGSAPPSVPHPRLPPPSPTPPHAVRPSSPWALGICDLPQIPEICPRFCPCHLPRSAPPLPSLSPGTPLCRDGCVVGGGSQRLSSSITPGPGSWHRSAPLWGHPRATTEGPNPQ